MLLSQVRLVPCPNYRLGQSADEGCTQLFGSARNYHDLRHGAGNRTMGVPRHMEIALS